MNGRIKDPQERKIAQLKKSKEEKNILWYEFFYKKM